MVLLKRLCISPPCTVESLLTGTSVKRTPRVGVLPSLLPLYLRLYKTDISLRRTLYAGPKDVLLSEG